MARDSGPVGLVASKGSVPGLRASQQRQSLLIGGAIVGGGVVAAAGLALGAFTLWQGWSLGAWNFAARGTAILLCSGLVLFAVRSLLPVRSNSQARSGAALVDLGLARAIRALGAMRLGLAGCAIAGAFGLAGVAIRYAAGDPPALSPAVDVVLLAGAALALLLFGFRVHGRLLGLVELRRLLRRR